VIIADTALSEQNVPVHRDNYLVNGSNEYDIVLPAGHYIAETHIPRTEHQVLSGRQSVIVEPFIVEKVPVIDYELITEKRNGQWTHVLLFNIKGNIIPWMRFDDGTHQFDIMEPDFEVEYDYSGTIHITFTLDEIVINNTFSFQQIPIQLTIDLPTLQAKLADRTINNERELIWNIIFHEDELVLNTQGSIGDNILVEINGGPPEPYDFGTKKSSNKEVLEAIDTLNAKVDTLIEALPKRPKQLTEEEKAVFIRNGVPIPAPVEPEDPSKKIDNAIRYFGGCVGEA